MPIKVTCQCGKSFAAKDELAGKAVKCPNCQKPLKIPAPAPAAAAPKPAAGQKPAGSPAARPKPAADGGVADLFDEIGLKPQVAGGRPCPGCAEPLGPDDVVCIKCGYNLKLGRRMETVKIGTGDPMAGGHSATAADLLERAAKTMEEDQAEERKKTGEGLPWWVYLVAFAVLVGFLGTMVVMANLAESKALEEKQKKTSVDHPAATMLA